MALHMEQASCPRRRRPPRAPRARSARRRDRRGTAGRRRSRPVVWIAVQASQSFRLSAISPSCAALIAASAPSALIASITVRCARIAVTSAWSYGGDTSTTSIPTSSTWLTIWRTARRSSRASIPPASGVPVAGAMPGIDDVDVDGQVDALGAVERLDDRVGEHRLAAPLLDLGHRVPTHALLAHPLERRLVGPVAAQPDLHEVLAGDPALLDQSAHRLPVRVQVPPLIGAGVGVRVEVDHADASAATRARATAAALGIGDRMVAAEHDRDRPGARDAEDLLVDHAERALEPCRHDGRIARIDDRQVRVRLGVQLDRPRVGRAPRGRRHPDRPRTEPRARARRHALVERRADDRDVGVRGAERLVVGRPRQLLERAVPVRVVRQVLARELRRTRPRPGARSARAGSRALSVMAREATQPIDAAERVIRPLRRRLRTLPVRAGPTQRGRAEAQPAERPSAAASHPRKTEEGTMATVPNTHTRLAVLGTAAAVGIGLFAGLGPTPGAPRATARRR